MDHTEFNNMLAQQAEDNIYFALTNSRGHVKSNNHHKRKVLNGYIKIMNMVNKATIKNL